MYIVYVLLEVQIENTEGIFTRRCAGMSFVAVALGGITRLTESGLSMVDWKLFGRRPPITAEVRGTKGNLSLVFNATFPKFVPCHRSGRRSSINTAARQSTSTKTRTFRWTTSSSFGRWSTDTGCGAGPSVRSSTFPLQSCGLRASLTKP